MTTKIVESNSQQHDIIIVIITLISIIITELGSCFIQSQQKSQEHLATSQIGRAHV